MIAVCGATGRIGSHVLALAGAADHPTIAVTEPGGQVATGMAMVRTAAFEDPVGLRNAFAGATRVLLVTPPDPRQVWWQRNIIDAAVEAGVEQLVKVSAYAAREQSPTNMGRWHYDGELALDEAELSHIVVRPQYFMDNLLRAAAGVRDHGVLRSIVPPGHPIAMVDARDVASVCFTLLADPRSVAAGRTDRVVVPTGPVAIDPETAASVMSAVLGREIRYEFQAHDAARADLRAVGVPSWRIQDTLAITRDCGPETTDAVLAVTGSPPRTLAEFVRHHRGELGD